MGSKALVWIVMLTGFPSLCVADSAVHSDAFCNDGKVSFTWHFGDSPTYPTGQPEWVGWDVLRRAVGDSCWPLVRVNDQPFPRIPGSHEYTFTETPPSRRTLYEYEAVPVNMNRQPLTISFCWPCSRTGWASCPNGVAPLTIGTLWDGGWALYILPCSQSCYESFYIEGPLVQELRQYAGTNTVLSFRGTASCGLVEGCRINITGYTVATPCGATAARPMSWSQIKTIYR